jgi:hypothetical protein
MTTPKPKDASPSKLRKVSQKLCFALRIIFENDGRVIGTDLLADHIAHVHNLSFVQTAASKALRRLFAATRAQPHDWLCPARSDEPITINRLPQSQRPPKWPCCCRLCCRSRSISHVL